MMQVDVDVKNNNDNQGNAQTAKVLWTPAAGSRILLMGCLLSASAALNVKVQTGSTDVIPLVYLPANGSLVIGGSDVPIWVGAADATLTYTSSGGTLSILLWGYEMTP